MNWKLFEAVFVWALFLLMLYLVFTTFPAKSADLPPFVTAKARAACEAPVRRYCVKGTKITYQTIKSCIRANWDKMTNDCQYEIVSLLPEIEKYEKRGK